MTQDDTTPRTERPGVWASMVDGGIYYMLPNLVFLGFSFLPFFTGDLPSSDLPRVIAVVIAIGILYVGVSFATTFPLWARIAWLVMLTGAITLLGVYGMFFVIYVTVAVAVLIPLLPALITITVVSFGVGITSAIFSEPIPVLLAGVALIGGAALAFGRVIWERNDRLRAAEERVATLAVAAERARIGRDLHDILGHSLTTITVKAQLAARLVDRDPERAKTELAELEEISRTALADVRSTASGMRSVRVASEVASARSVLTAAGIQVETPSAMPVLTDERSELFGYVVREAVTNVVRHSDATHCAITVARGHVEVTDDGRGGANRAGGSGLTGLASRVEGAGLRLVLSSGATGTTVRVEAA